MEKIFEQGMLYDFYGELLTEHQRKIYEDAVYNDMSLSEIAQEAGISRQGVHDLIKRCDRILQEYEEKLHLLERFLETKKTASEINRLATEALGGEDAVASVLERKTAEMSECNDNADCRNQDNTETLTQIKQLSKQLIEEL